MQKIYLKKLIDLNHQLKELISISVDESIRYNVEDDGMRAIGAIIINGEYKTGEMNKGFQESIDLDILATFDKIIDKREFHVKVEDFNYNINEGDLSMMIQANIYGVKDDNDRMIEAHVEHNDDEVVKEIESFLNNEEVLDHSINKNDYKEDVIDTTETDDNDDIGTYYLYVISDNDTYATIAQRYQISEEILKNYNHQKSLAVGQIIIIPYVA